MPLRGARFTAEAVVTLGSFGSGEHFSKVCDCISANGSFFNTQRMVQQYVVKAYMS